MKWKKKPILKNPDYERFILKTVFWEIVDREDKITPAESC